MKLIYSKFIKYHTRIIERNCYKLKAILFFPEFIPFLYSPLVFSPLALFETSKAAFYSSAI
jgi:hypothetical protein